MRVVMGISDRVTRPRPRREDRRGHAGRGPPQPDASSRPTWSPSDVTPPRPAAAAERPAALSDRASTARRPTRARCSSWTTSTRTTATSTRSSGISMTVERGEIVTLIGANGAGKTTTLKTISRAAPPAPGTVSFEGRDISKIAGPRARPGRDRPGARRPPDLLPDDGPREPPDGRVHPRSQARSSPTSSACSRCSRGSRERIGQLGGTLSGGEQQMLAIGRALMSRPHCSCSTSRRWASPRSSSSRSSRRSARSTPRARRSCSWSRTPSRRSSIANRGYVLQTGEVRLTGPASELHQNEMVRKAYLGEQ